MEYIKRKYKDVKGTFDFALQCKYFFKTYELYGINSLGIWIWPEFNEQPHGFFEWKWIKEILVLEKDGAVYIVMPDMDKIIDSVCLVLLKGIFKKMFVDSQANGDKALVYALDADWVTLLNEIIAREYVRVISIE